MNKFKRQITEAEKVESPKKKSRQRSPLKQLNNNAEFADEFFDDDTDFALMLQENGDARVCDINSPCEIKEEPLDLSCWKRCVVEGFELDPRKGSLIVHLRGDDATSKVATCRLESPWCFTKFELGDIVSVQAVWNNGSSCFEVTVANGYFVTYPDFLISGTSVVGSLFCKRRAVLQDKFRGLDSDNKIMVIGSIIHELLQIVLGQKLSSYEEILNASRQLLKSSDKLYTLYASKMTEAEVHQEAEKFIPNIVRFVEEYILGKRKPEVNKECFSGVIDHIQDIEENLWVPQFGLKGKIDVTVQVRQRYAAPKRMPLELKTGRASFSSEHKGQVIIYQLMQSEVGKSVDSGLLLYLREGIMKEVPATRNEKRDLIMLRNDLAYYLTRNMKPKRAAERIGGNSDDLTFKFEKMELPDPINHHNACDKCPYSTICCSFLKTDSSCELSANHPLQKISKECTDHLSKSDLEYFINWCGILSLEEQEMRKSNHIRSLWTERPEERGARGRAIINLKISSGVTFKEGKFVHTFIIKEDVENDSMGSQSANSDLSLSGFVVGEYVVVSTTKRIAVAAGFVYDITKNSITLGLERNLRKNYCNDSFIVDKHESMSGNIFNFTNLGVLLDNIEPFTQLRKIIVDKAPPTFSKVLPKVIAKEGVDILVNLNAIQRKAVVKALTANEYMLIKGLPGTGKTQTLITIISLLNMIGKSVLVTSHTHSAVDNVLIRLKQRGLKFIRLGSDARINPQLREYSESHLTANCNTPEALENVYSSYNIVGVTCLGSSHPIFIHRTFDVCIVDEATQVFQPTILRPIFYSRKFILVGDPEQLPPLVRSKEVRSLGADESLFHRLDSAEATSVLSLQYRMNKCITKLANELTYKGELKCANEAVASSSLQVPNRAKLLQDYKPQRWLTQTLEKHVDFSVVFLDTQNCLQASLSFAESQTCDPSRIIEDRFSQDVSPKKKERKFQYTNYCDAALALYIVQALVKAGYASESIGIVAPYRAQVELLRKLSENMQHLSKEDYFSGLEVNTVDQYQGRDKEIIIFSCTKTGTAGDIGNKAKENEILEDRRRLTVAITRSKHKLILIGDQQCLKGYSPFADLLKQIPSRCKITLEEGGKLGFSWSTVFGSLKEFVNA